MSIDHVTCHMFTKEPQSLDLIQAKLVHSSRKEYNKSYVLWRLHCLIFLNLWYEERGNISKAVQLLLLQVLNLCENYDTKCKISHMAC